MKTRSWHRYDVSSSRYRARHKNVSQDVRGNGKGKPVISTRTTMFLPNGRCFMIMFRYILSAMIIKIGTRDVDKDTNLLMCDKRFLGWNRGSSRVKIVGCGMSWARNLARNAGIQKLCFIPIIIDILLERHTNGMVVTKMEERGGGGNDGEIEAKNAS